LTGASPADRAIGEAAALPDPVDRFFRALSELDVEGLRACLHPGFEMVVPQRPARGFKGREQEISNMQFLFDTYPDFSVTVLRKAVSGNEVWTETTAQATGLEMAAVVIWTVDPDSGTIVAGRYYSEPVWRDAPEINEFVRSIGRGGAGPRVP
jgi:ketosteroid isomerase-like protein